MNRPLKIKRLLDEKGWSQAVLADRCQLKPRTVAYIVSGEREPGVASAIRFASALEVPVDWLFDDSRDWPPPTPLDVRLLPDAVILEEALRRKRSFRQAVLFAWEHYLSVRDRFVSLVSHAEGELTPTRAEEWAANFDELLRVVASYGPILTVWARFEGMWDALEIVVREPRDAKEAQLKEMFQDFDFIESTVLNSGSAPPSLGPLLDKWALEYVRFIASRAARIVTPDAKLGTDPALPHSAATPP